MSDETTIITIETIKKKLKKYTALKEHEKVEEYLRKLHKISFTPIIIQETEIDKLIRQIASNKTAAYNSSAKHLLKRWHHKQLLYKSATVEPVINQNVIIVEKDLSDNRRNSVVTSESQLPDDNKKRKVLSLAQYLENKKHVLSPSSAINSTQKKLTDVQIQFIQEQFKATTEKLTASTADLTKIMNKSLTDIDNVSNNEIDFTPKRFIVEQQTRKFYDFWTEEDDDDNERNMQLHNNEPTTVNISIPNQIVR